MLKLSTLERYSSRSVRRQSAAIRVPGERVDTLKLSVSVAPNSLHFGMLEIWFEDVMIPRFLESAIRSAIGDHVPIRAVRFQDEVESIGPSVLYRMSGGSELAIMDGRGVDKTFEIECRSQSIEGTAAMADDILEQLSRDGRLAEILDQAGDADSPSGQRGRYFAHTITVRIQA